MPPSPFKAYDLRGRVGEGIDAALMRRVGHAFAREVAEGAPVVIGRDMRESSPMLLDALAEGLADGGSDALDIGLCGTEEVYFATDHLGAGGGLMVTASHNPKGDNGLKLVRRGARPVSREDGLARVQALAEGGDLRPRSARGRRRQVAPRDAYVARILSFVDPARLAPLHILVNAGNGAAGPTFDAIAEAIAAAGAPLRFTRMHHEPDADFPHGVPNPLLPENQPPTGDAVRAAGADFGVAWDGDFDRCFFFDQAGAFVDGVYLVGLLARAVLRREPGARIVYDPRAVLNTRAVLAEAGGQGVMARTGHSYMKAVMRARNAAYGGEMSAHHYFRDFMFCDSGMIPWLKLAEEVSATGQGLGALVADRIAAFPVSGERNFRLADPAAAVARVEAAYAAQALHRDDSDGLSLEFADWRFNLRRSNTEALVRLNVESAGDASRVATEVARIGGLLAEG
ncbi:phosphomannomutase [Halovulum dunhuangense]|uniref:Phosphomannomutase n=1 Tax=Halovulum dunhuangense TaxID=1505036 RepID=A0A849L381_9RHOB|nr:phosphomannomutase [Halovulum dunhuangense]NNU80838.1 phosphomannomutase [Halovulum dunhuangense]